MKNKKVLFALPAAVAALALALYLHKPQVAEREAGGITYEERPDAPMLTGREKEMFEEYLRRRESESVLKSASATMASSYAGGKITGTWRTKIPHTGWHGYRVDNSAYDSLRNVFYVVSYAGHLYRMEYNPEVKWTLLNHKTQMNPSDNGTANPLFLGTLLPDSTFRLLRSNDAANRMEYSDNEGATWLPSTGASVTQSWSNQAFEMTANGQKKIVLHTYAANNHYLYFSADNGATYTKSSLSFPVATYDVRIAKPFHTNDAYLWVWRKDTKAISTYKYNPDKGDYELAVASTSTLAGTNLSSAAATFYNGTLHFYLATINTTYTVYYSNDGGATWTQKNAGRDKPFEIVCPEQPNIIMSGFEDMRHSADYGANWINSGNKLGWDLQHMRVYDAKDGKTIALAGMDFGCFVSQTPSDYASYKWCNNGASFGMHYDAASSENFNSIYMANQDRGTTAYRDTATDVNTVDVDGTDVLRVTYAKHETSIWTWFYYGRIKHKYNFATGQSGEAVYDGLGNWWAAPLIPSPNPGEDAVYAAYGSNLQVFSHNATTNAITKTAHAFNFKTTFGDDLAGFGYSELNRNLWYAALNNGTFLYSKDGGSTWNKSIYGGTKPKGNDQSYNYAKNQMVIRASQIDTNKVYCAGVANGILISSDCGKTFALKTNGMNVYRVRDFALSPDEKFIFAACGYNGAWVYSVDNSTWYQMSDAAIPTVDFTDVEFIHRKNCVRFGTFGSGVLELALDQQFYALASPGNLTASLNPTGRPLLSWNDLSADEEGFYVERAIGGDFERIDTLQAGASTFTDTTAANNQTCYYRVKAFKGSTVSFKSNVAYVTVPAKGVMGQQNWSLVECSSEEVTGEYSPAKYAFDNNPATYWHTAWKNSQPAHPHSITIDLGEESTIAGFRYLPRQDGSTIGSIAKYQFYVTNDLSAWGTPVVSGTFTSGTGWKEALLSAATTGRYVKLVALSEISGGIYASAAEIAVLYKVFAPDTPINVTATTLNATTVTLRWKDVSLNSTGVIIEQKVGDAYVPVATVSKILSVYSHKNLQPGTTYTYRIKSYNAAGQSDPSAEVSATTTGITGVKWPDVKWDVSPSPFTTVLNIKLEPLGKSAVVNIIGMNGQTYLTNPVEAGQTQLTIPTGHLPKGSYVVELTSNGRRAVQKVVKQ